MDLNQWIRAIAGLLIMVSVALGLKVSPNWFYFTGFVGLNLLQSAITRWCPMMSILRALGVRS